MSDSNHDDSNLAEVKAVLGRLQRISRNPQAADKETAGDAARPASAGTESRAVRAKGASMPIRATLLIGPVLAVAAGVAIISLDRQPAPDGETSAAAPQEPVPARVAAQEAGAQIQTASPPARAVAPGVVRSLPATPLQLASELMDSGQVRAARDVLLRAAREESADAAWALARSYDPNFLVTIRGADATPDVAEATRWYRAWYDIAVKQGLVADSVSLDRIIRSMGSN